MPTARPIVVMMLTTKMESSNARPMIAVMPHGHDDAQNAKHQRDARGDQRAEDDDEDDQRNRQADQFGLLQVLFGGFVKRQPDASLAGGSSGEPVLAIDGFEHTDDFLRSVYWIAFEHTDGDQERMAALRDELRCGRFEVAHDFQGREGTQLGDDALASANERWIVNRRGLGMEDHRSLRRARRLRTCVR